MCLDKYLTLTGIGQWGLFALLRWSHLVNFQFKLSVFVLQFSHIVTFIGSTCPEFFFFLLLCHSCFCRVYWCFQSKIVRVLNLWQKNAVFKSDIIQPLLDMAAGIPPPTVTPVIPSSAAPVNNTTPGQSEYA